jgi:hypothetical protein
MFYSFDVAARRASDVVQAGDKYTPVFTQSNQPIYPIQLTRLSEYAVTRLPDARLLRGALRV